MLLSRPQSSSSTIGPVHGGAISGYREREAPAPFNLSAIGSILKETRERRGISIVGAAEKLFVKKSTLKAIESGQWVSLPHSVYVKGYIRSYASYLDILDAVEKGLSSPRESTEYEPETIEGISGRGKSKGDDDRPLSKSNLSFLPKIVLLCSTILGVLLGLAVSSGIQSTTIVSAKDILVGCHLAIADVRRIILP